jgi:hypothetical protein
MTEHFDYRKLSDRDFAEQRLREGRELEERDAEWARAKRQRQREEQRTRRSEVDALRDELRAEIDVLRRDCDARYDVQMKAIGEVIGETVERADDAIKKVQNELFALVERRFGELIGRLEAIAPGALKDPARGKDFRFAGERDDGPIDLPNPLRRRELN